MKFKLDIQKKNRGNIGQAKGHNCREHGTGSQLPKTAWITPEGHHVVKTWRQEVLDKAEGLAKRKDAVVAIELVFQVGNQTDWREPPSAENKHGKPISLDEANSRLRKFTRGVARAIEAEFGAENIVGIDLHTDESTPHVHVIVTPVKDGKLQAKAWLDGKSKCGALRERLHDVLSKHIECDYTKGGSNHEPHDPKKAAGGALAPQPELGWLKRKTDKVAALTDDKNKLQQMIEKLHRQFTLKLEQFSKRVKELIKQVENLKAENEDLKQQLRDAKLDASAEKRDKQKLIAANGGLRSELDKLADHMAQKRQQDAFFDLGRKAGRSGPEIGR